MRYASYPRLHPGDKVAVIAPAGVPEAQALERGITLLRERYEVLTFRDLLGNQYGMHAGPDAVRADELRWALGDPEIRCVIAARGGYGTARALTRSALAGLRKNPRAVVGFSDVTVLLAATHCHAGLQAIHGPMVCQLGRRGKSALNPLVKLLENDQPQPALEGLESLHSGVAQGPLIGGNLTVLTHLVGTPWWPDLRGAILFLEDVGERPYRLDRCLTHLRQTGVLDKTVGLAIGSLTDCEAEGGEAPALEILRRFCDDMRWPGVCEVPAGHGPQNVPLLLGAFVTLDATAGRLEFHDETVTV